jgi:hypothetical protein
MYRALLIGIVLIVAAILPSTVMDAEAAGDPCALLGNSQDVYDTRNNIWATVTVADCVYDVGNYDAFGLNPPDPGYLWYAIELRYDAYVAVSALPYLVNVANCTGYLAPPDAVYYDFDPFDGIVDWPYLEQGNWLELQPGESVSALLFFEVSVRAGIAHVYFLNMTGENPQLLDLSIDGGFHGSADTGAVRMSFSIPSAKLRSCRAD